MEQTETQIINQFHTSLFHIFPQHQHSFPPLQPICINYCSIFAPIFKLIKDSCHIKQLSHQTILQLINACLIPLQQFSQSELLITEPCADLIDGVLPLIFELETAFGQHVLMAKETSGRLFLSIFPLVSRKTNVFERINSFPHWIFENVLPLQRFPALFYQLVTTPLPSSTATVHSTRHLLDLSTPIHTLPLQINDIFSIYTPTCNFLQHFQNQLLPCPTTFTHFCIIIRLAQYYNIPFLFNYDNWLTFYLQFNHFSDQFEAQASLLPQLNKQQNDPYHYHFKSNLYVICENILQLSLQQPILDNITTFDQNATIYSKPLPLENQSTPLLSSPSSHNNLNTKINPALFYQTSPRQLYDNTFVSCIMHHDLLLKLQKYISIEDKLTFYFTHFDHFLHTLTFDTAKPFRPSASLAALYSYRPQDTKQEQCWLIPSIFILFDSFFKLLYQIVIEFGNLPADLSSYTLKHIDNTGYNEVPDSFNEFQSIKQQGLTSTVDLKPIKRQRTTLVQRMPSPLFPPLVGFHSILQYQSILSTPFHSPSYNSDLEIQNFQNFQDNSGSIFLPLPSDPTFSHSPPSSHCISKAVDSDERVSNHIYHQQFTSSWTFSSPFNYSPRPALNQLSQKKPNYLPGTYLSLIPTSNLTMTNLCNFPSQLLAKYIFSIILPIIKRVEILADPFLKWYAIFTAIAPQPIRSRRSKQPTLRQPLITLPPQPQPLSINFFHINIRNDRTKVFELINGYLSLTFLPKFFHHFPLFPTIFQTIMNDIHTSDGDRDELAKFNIDLTNSSSYSPHSDYHQDQVAAQLPFSFSELRQIICLLMRLLRLLIPFPAAQRQLLYTMIEHNCFIYFLPLLFDFSPGWGSSSMLLIFDILTKDLKSIMTSLKTPSTNTQKTNSVQPLISLDDDSSQSVSLSVHFNTDSSTTQYSSQFPQSNKNSSTTQYSSQFPQSNKNPSTTDAIFPNEDFIISILSHPYSYSSVELGKLYPHLITGINNYNSKFSSFSLTTSEIQQRIRHFIIQFLGGIPFPGPEKTDIVSKNFISLSSASKDAMPFIIFITCLGNSLKFPLIFPLPPAPKFSALPPPPTPKDVEGHMSLLLTCFIRAQALWLHLIHSNERE